MLQAGAPPPEAGAPAQAQAPRPEILKTVTVLLGPEDDLEDFKRALGSSGGRTIGTRLLDPVSRREAFDRHRARAALRAGVSRGWELTVRMRRRAIPGFVAALERRPGWVLLDQRRAPASGRDRQAEELTLRITVLR